MVAGSISGSGTLWQSGSADVVLVGNNSYSGKTIIDTGTSLQVGYGDTIGNLGDGDVDNNGWLGFSRSDLITVNNRITGSGEVAHYGSGTIVLTGANSYLGGTEIGGGGTLAIIDGQALSSGEVRFSGLGGTLLGSGSTGTALDVSNNLVVIGSQTTGTIAAASGTTPLRLSGSLDSGRCRPRHRPGRQHWHRRGQFRQHHSLRR